MVLVLLAPRQKCYLGAVEAIYASGLLKKGLLAVGASLYARLGTSMAVNRGIFFKRDVLPAPISTKPDQRARNTSPP